MVSKPLSCLPINSTSKTDVAHYSYQGKRIARQSLADIRMSFENKAAWYDCFLRGLLPATDSGPVLDTPCGHGNFLYYLRTAGWRQVRGFDLDEDRVKVAQALGLPAACGDVFTILRQSESLALIASLDFFEHIDKDLVPELIQECHRALRPGGVLLVRMPVTDAILGAYDLYNDYTHKWAGNSGMLQDLLLQEGFAQVIVKDESPVLYKPLNYPRLALFHLAKAATNTYLRVLGFPPMQIWSRSAWFIATKAV